jgi:hypothetical protein
MRESYDYEGELGSSRRATLARGGRCGLGGRGGWSGGCSREGEVLPFRTQGVGVCREVGAVQ